MFETTALALFLTVSAQVRQTHHPEESLLAFFVEASSTSRCVRQEYRVSQS
jgi:hypothetical protein